MFLQAVDWKKIAAAAVIASSCNQITFDPAFATIVSNNNTRAFAQGFTMCSVINLGSESGMHVGLHSCLGVAGAFTGFAGGAYLGQKTAIATGTYLDKREPISNRLAKIAGCSCGLVTTSLLFNE